MNHKAPVKQRKHDPLRCDETRLEIKMMDLEGAVLDEVDVWLPDVAVMVQSVESWVPEMNILISEDLICKCKNVRGPEIRCKCQRSLMSDEIYAIHLFPSSWTKRGSIHFCLMMNSIS